MQTCFVIQPFDSGKFDQRFEDIYKPALENAGLKAYRVDEDPGVEVPIQAIEDGINKATICLADITTDNPNVWYELGYAFAANCPVIMICSDERKGGFPFDIQHRAIVRYTPNSLSDFEKLKDEISQKAQALLMKSASTRGFVETEQTSSVKKLGQTEILVLRGFLERATISESEIYLHFLEQNLVPSEMTRVEFNLAFQKLKDKLFVEVVRIFDSAYGEPDDYNGARITPDGWNWIRENESYFILKNDDEENYELDDDIPFP